MPKILPPKPLDRPPDPAPLLRLCRGKGAEWIPSTRYRCPLCHGAPRDAKPDERRREDTLDVTTNLNNEVVVRCHLCGFAGTALTLLRRTAQPPWEEIPGILERARVFGGEPVPPEWVERSRVWEEFANLFAQAEAYYRIRVRAGKHVHPQFGEVGLAVGTDLDAVLPGLRLGKRWGKGFYHVEVRRSLSGLPLAAVIIQMRTGREVARHRFQPPEPVEVLAPEWALHKDWSGVATVCTDITKAAETQKGLAEGGRSLEEPLVWVANCTGEILDVPMCEVRYAPGDGEPGDFALAFARGNTVVTIGGKDAVAAVAEEIASGGGDPARHLDGVLAKPWVSEEAGRRLTRAVADRTGEPLESLLGRSGLCENVLACKISRFNYIARGGIILKRCGKGNWSPCSNFSLRLEESAVGGGDVTHRLRLFLGGGSVPFEAGDEDFADGKRVMRLATSAAVGAGLGLPNMAEPRDISLLPAIVRETSVPAMVPARPTELGFAGDRFHGSNFTVSTSGIRFGKGVMSGNLLPERMLLSEAAHLALKANELGTWLGRLGRSERTMAGAVIHAALAWLHRGGRNLDSFLLMPSRMHLDLLGRLLGITPIEVGRSREDRGVPRLVASQYSERHQFLKQGGIVAAVEDKGRRADPSIPIMVHSRGGVIPDPPSSCLGLFTYACLGARDVGEAATKMSCLAEDPAAGSAIRKAVDLGGLFYVPPEGYLDCFLAAVARHLNHREMEIESRGRKLLKREAVRRLRQFGYDFSETRLIGELRVRTGEEQPARFGRGRVPVLVLGRNEEADSCANPP